MFYEKLHDSFYMEKGCTYIVNDIILIDGGEGAMRKVKILCWILMVSCFMTSCGITGDNSVDESSNLNETQIEILALEGLPTNYDELTPSQQHTIDRIYEMLSYLNEKYGEEFIYSDYIPQELLQTETLIAYPRSTGAGNGKYLVTVKAESSGFTDNYFDFGVGDLA